MMHAYVINCKLVFYIPIANFKDTEIRKNMV